jgi:hypothetical protein
LEEEEEEEVDSPEEEVDSPEEEVVERLVKQDQLTMLN